MIVVKLFYTVLVYPEACSPDDEDEGDKLSCSLQLLLVTFAELIISVAKLHRF